MVGRARYDAVADFYTAGWSDDLDPVTTCLPDLLGAVAGQRVLDMALGHGRTTRTLARRRHSCQGRHFESADHQGNRCGKQCTTGHHLRSRGRGRARITGECRFQCRGTRLRTVRHRRSGRCVGRRTARPNAPVASLSSRFRIRAFPAGSVFDGSSSTLRQQVGAKHRTLSTYLNTPRRHGPVLDETAERVPPADRATTRPATARLPVFLVARLIKSAVSTRANRVRTGACLGRAGCARRMVSGAASNSPRYRARLQRCRSAAPHR